MIEFQETNLKVKKLELKCEIYEKQLAEYARNRVGRHPQQPQQRYNMQEMANKITQLAKQYETAMLQSNTKDNKIAELSVDLSRTKTKLQELTTYRDKSAQKPELRSNSSSAKKPTN